MSDATMPVAALQALPIFPFADAFPFISDEESLELAQDIEVNGLCHPIVLCEFPDPETGEIVPQILDGRNRLRALRQTKVTSVAVEHFAGTEYQAAEFVRSANVLRRHMSAGQRAFAALAFLPYEERQRGGDHKSEEFQNQSAGSGTLIKARDIVAEKFGMKSGQRVSEAKRLNENAADLAEAVKTGTMALDAAVRELQKRQGKSPGATAGDKAAPVPATEYGLGGNERSTAYPERDVSYADRRSGAVEVLVRNAVRMVEQINHYALTDGDVVDCAELPDGFAALAYQLGDFFADLGTALDL